MKGLAIAGSTGSIGTQTLEIVRQSKDEFLVEIITGYSNTQLLIKQALEFHPRIIVTGSEESKKYIETALSQVGVNPIVLFGEDGIREAIRISDFDILVNGIMGFAGLLPSYEVLKKGKDLALANKESLVAGGRVLLDIAKKSGSRIIPVDSEHSAIYQSLIGNKRENLKKVILTGSGGPFRNFNISHLEKINIEDALNHPNWAMGKKITIDSATLMNKGLEYIEAKRLFNLDTPSQIEVLIHKESILHSAVEYIDGSIIGQMGRPDMKVPIAYAITGPDRIEIKNNTISLSDISQLTFEKPDLETFTCLKMAMEVANMEDSYGIVLNAANEVLVAEFLKGNIGFLTIQRLIEKMLFDHNPQKISDIYDIVLLDKIVREDTQKVIEKEEL